LKLGFSRITVAQQLHAKIAGLWGNIIGLSCGVLTFSIYIIFVNDFKWWWTIVVLIASVWLNIIELIGTKQQYRQACEIQDMINQSKVS
jgi:hypothetical protein